MSESDIVTVSRSITVASGVFAPGHLGELTQYLPFELVDDVLEQTGKVQRRLRDLPSRVGVYLLLNSAIFPELGVARVWDKMVSGLEGTGLDLPTPSSKALRDLRDRIGAVPVRTLFETVAGSLAQPHTPGVRYRGLRTLAFDGCKSVKVADTGDNRAWLGRIQYRLGFAGYPTPMLMTLVETGTRGLHGAVIGGTDQRDEIDLARRLLPLLGPGMLVLADRYFDCALFFREIADTGARLLIRGKAGRKPPVLQRLPDGSYLSILDGLEVRVIEAVVTVTGQDGSQVGDRYRLITTLLDHRRYPAGELVALYHERWEIEVAYLALRHTLLDGYVLRRGTRIGVEQQIWALLTVYQLLRMAMVTAAESAPGTDPDRASFTTALQTARDQITNTAGVLPTTHGPIDLIGAIGRAVLRTLLPARRLRYSVRKVKSPLSRYGWRDTDDPRPRHSTNIKNIDVAIYGPPATAGPTRSKPPTHTTTPNTADRSPTRRQLVTKLMNTDPGRHWHGRDLAEHLHITARNLLTQLAEWARQGYLTRTRAGTYTLPQQT